MAGEGNDNPVQYSYWRIPWRGTFAVHRAAKSQKNNRHSWHVRSPADCKLWLYTDEEENSRGGEDSGLGAEEERERDREEPTDGAFPSVALQLSALPPSPQLPSQGNQPFLAALPHGSLPLTVWWDKDPLALMPTVTRTGGARPSGSMPTLCFPTRQGSASEPLLLPHLPTASPSTRPASSLPGGQLCERGTLLFSVSLPPKVLVHLAKTPSPWGVPGLCVLLLKAVESPLWTSPSAMPFKPHGTVPLDCKEIQPVHPKGNQSRIFIGSTDVEAETPVLWPPDAKS